MEPKMGEKRKDPPDFPEKLDFREIGLKKWILDPDLPEFKSWIYYL